MPYTPQIKFCKACGQAVEHRIPDDGDTRVRAVCPACHTVHYVNPLNVVGTLPYLNERVLLCKRAIAPRMGKWTLPAGFMEMDETMAEGAERETMEEAGAQVVMGKLFTLISVPHVSQVHAFFLAQLTSESFDPGPESLEVQLFSLDAIPWEELAFPTVAKTLRHYIRARETGDFTAQCFDLRPPVGHKSISSPSL